MEIPAKARARIEKQLRLEYARVMEETKTNNPKDIFETCVVRAFNSRANYGKDWLTVTQVGTIASTMECFKKK